MYSKRALRAGSFGGMIHAKRMSKKEENRRIGQLGEGIAAKFLESNGFTVIERNYKRKFGEVDIIAKKGAVVHFVEVKSTRYMDIPDVTRENGGYRPEELVHPKKLEKIRRVGEFYINKDSKDLHYQIDVIAVFIDEARKIGRCRFIENVN